jgi:hypothetical protein
MNLTNDRSWQDGSAHRLRLFFPVIVLVLGATAVPVEIRPFSLSTLSLGLSTRDVVVNVLLYIPVGMVLTELSAWRAIGFATLISLLAELCQFYAMHRYPSPIDLATNIVGAIVGWGLTRHWRIAAPTIRLSPRIARLSMLAAAAVLGSVAMILFQAIPAWQWLSANVRGSTSPGTLEAYWPFDRVDAGASRDVSGNGLHGRLVGGAGLSEGVRGSALSLKAETDYAELGQPLQLQLMGSMTICAWIKSTAFPRDDAVIVSNFPSYQLDTTVDTGARTIGFKLADPCENGMARYGATELVLGHWYHVAGVYDADERTIDVYLDGHLDNGALMGPVIPVHGPSIQPVYVGRRSDLPGYEFSGLIDEARIYSRALSQDEIRQAMEGGKTGDAPTGETVRAWASSLADARVPGYARGCPELTCDEDTFVPGLMVSAGLLCALASAGFWPGNRLAGLGVGTLVGVLLAPAAALGFPSFVPWTLPLLTLAGSASVAFSRFETVVQPHDQNPGSGAPGSI